MKMLSGQFGIGVYSSISSAQTQVNLENKNKNNHRLQLDRLCAEQLRAIPSLGLELTLALKMLLKKPHEQS